MRFELEEVHGLLLPKRDKSTCCHIRRTGKLAWNQAFNRVPAWNALKPGSVVFDVGAFIGDTAQVFLQRKCEVHAFEPIPEIFVCLLHNCPEAHCYNIALGDGTKYSTVSVRGNMGGTWLRPGDKYSLRLDDLLIGRMDVLKIDVEGFEYKVLQGAWETIERLHPMIHIELNVNGLERFNASPAMVRKALLDLGYRNQIETQRCNEGYNSHCDLLCRYEPSRP